jgi:transposase InsO family protein
MIILKEVILSMNTIKHTKKWQEDEALRRFRLISPLLDESLDPAKRLQVRKAVAENSGLTPRSLYRYEAAYRADGFAGLKPMSREQRRSPALPENFDALVGEAIQLKREVPTRSVAQIILILEMEGLAAPGVLKRSTLQRYLYDAGFGRKQMKKYTEARKSSSRRFCKAHRMQLAQADIKYIMKLPIGPGGKMTQCYICSIIDDHSKMILGSGVYDNQEASIVEDVYRRAILSYGAFDATYVDNGTQFISKELVDALARLGIRHLRAKPYSGQSKGKVEVYNRLINSYMAECRAQKVRTLEEARHWWKLFVEDYYHDKPHGGIREYYKSQGIDVPPEGITPRQEFNRDSRPLRYLDAGIVGQAFLHHDTRVVDKGACISFEGRKYEVSSALIGAEVEISWDPMAPETVTVSYPGVKPFLAKPLRIGGFSDPKPELPQSMLPEEAECSRFLQGLQKVHERKQAHSTNAISFGDYRKEAGGHV